MAKQPKTQADQRRDMNADDQFGRAWCLSIELSTGDPCGQITQAGWTDPLRTPQGYLAVPRNRFRQPEYGKIRVDFDAWISDQTKADEEWRRHFLVIAAQKHPAGFDPEMIWTDAWIRHLTGPEPFPSPAVLRAAKAGHQGFLGLVPLTRQDRKALTQSTVEDLLTETSTGEAANTATVDLTAPALASAPAATVTYQQFVASAMKEGKSMSQAATLWREHKKNLLAEKVA